MRFTKSIYDKLNEYSKVYLEKILNTDNPTDMLDQFDYTLAAENIREAMLAKDKLTGETTKCLMDPDFCNKTREYIYKRIPALYLCSKYKDMTPELAETFIRDKGSSFFIEFKTMQTYKIEAMKPFNYIATQSQKSYIQTFNVNLLHEEQLTGREANEIIKSLKTRSRTRPIYYNYFISGKKENPSKINNYSINK